MLAASQDGRDLNMTMFSNVLDALEQYGSTADATLHVQLMEGRLAYGGWAVAPSLFPSREDRPDRSPSWYFDQEDYLIARMERLAGTRHPRSHALAWTRLVAFARFDLM